MPVSINSTYEHYKGGLYRVIAIARLEPEGMAGEEYVVYEAQNDSMGGATSGQVWIRAKSIFESEVTWNGEKVQRFTPIASRG